MKNCDLHHEVLDEATVAAIQDGLKAERRGDFLTIEQAIAWAKAQRGQGIKGSSPENS